MNYITVFIIHTFVLPFRRFLQLCSNELMLMGHMYRHYKVSYAINTLMTTADFVWWMLLLDNFSLVPAKIAPMAVGYIIWLYANYIIYDANYLIIETSQTGVLEQLYVSATPLYMQLMARFTAGTIMCTAELCVVVVMLYALCPLYIPLSFGALAVFILIIMGICGFAFTVAGIGLIFKKSQSFCYMLLNVLLFFNGSIIPLERLPVWLQVISKYVFPTTLGIELLRGIMFHNQTLWGLIVQGTFFTLAANSCVYFILGLHILRICEFQAQKQGVLGHY